jgi:PIN domain nuclease of toxin-antitoxin system
MGFLIDTHVFIWYATGDKRLGKNIISILENDNQIYLSIASLWEMAIKVNIGRLEFKEPFEQIATQQIAINNYKVLNIKPEHTFHLSNLELIHKDPFDRIIISQAIIENMPVISKDNYFKNYGIEVVW